MEAEVESITVTGFKGISEARFQPKGLSIMAGVNSGGKSSLIQSLLVLAQSISVNKREESSRIRTNGNLVMLGPAEYLVNTNADCINYEFELKIPSLHYRSYLGNLPRTLPGSVQPKLDLAKRSHIFVTLIMKFIPDDHDRSALKLQDVRLLDVEGSISLYNQGPLTGKLGETPSVYERIVNRDNLDVLNLYQLGDRLFEPGGLRSKFVIYSGIYAQEILTTIDRRALKHRIRRWIIEGENEKNPHPIAKALQAINTKIQLTSYVEVGSKRKSSLWRISDGMLSESFEGIDNEDIIAEDHGSSKRPRRSEYDYEGVFLQLKTLTGYLRDGTGDIANDLLDNILDYVLRDYSGDYIRIDLPGSQSMDEWAKYPLSTLNTVGFLCLGFEEFETIKRLNRGAQIIEKFLGSIRYIGPLRSGPQVAYGVDATSEISPLGLKGTSTAEFLYRNKELKIASRNGIDQNIINRINQAVSEIGIAAVIESTLEDRQGFTLKVRINGQLRYLTEVGAGVAQVLPIVTLVVASPRKSFVILEQPELHLHPAMQARLAQFLQMEAERVAILCETHSDYIVTRVRRNRIRNSIEAMDGALYERRQIEGVKQKRHRESFPAQVNFLWSKPKLAAKSTSQSNRGIVGFEISPLKLDKFGDIESWPEGFFDSQYGDMQDIVSLKVGFRRGRSEGEN